MYVRLATLMALACSLFAASAGFAEDQLDFSPWGYYQVRPDMRKCVSPLCGGFWVKRVNKIQTRCADRTLQSECYVAAMRKLPSSGFDAGVQVLLRGRIKSRNFDGFGKMGVFVIRTAWIAATDKLASGDFVGLENNGIVCITTPCFSSDEHLLNGSVTRSVSGIDLHAAGAADELENAALEIIGNGGVLVASGVNQQVEESNGTVGLVFRATQFYLPIP